VFSRLDFAILLHALGDGLAAGAVSSLNAVDYVELDACPRPLFGAVEYYLPILFDGQGDSPSSTG
jgi:hypothetical protein